MKKRKLLLHLSQTHFPSPLCDNNNNNRNAFYKNLCSSHPSSQSMYVLASSPSSTMHATSMSCLMDNFLAPQYISVKHLTFINTDQFNILCNEGPHQFKA